MVNQQTLYITFAGQQVVVQSNAAEVLAGLERNFRRMLAPEPTTPVGRLEVWHKDGLYHLAGNGATRLVDRSLANILGHLGRQVILSLIQSRPDLLWLHAGAVAGQERAMIISAPSGRGKSTLVSGLCGQGWTYLADDIVPLDPARGRIMPFLQTPMVRRGPSREMSRHCPGKLKKTEVNLEPKSISWDSVPVGALVFPSYSANSSKGLIPCSPARATLELLANSLNFVDHREAAVRYFSKLVKDVPAFYLSFNSVSLLSQMSLGHNFDFINYFSY